MAVYRAWEAHQIHVSDYFEDALGGGVTNETQWVV